MTDKDRSADGLRGLAALSVVFTHFIAAFLPSVLRHNYPELSQAPPTLSPTLELLSLPFPSVLYNGHFAVLLFFVLSGYVLTKPYFLERDITTLKKRLWSRYLRLNLPIAAAVVLSYLVFKLGLYFNVEAAPLSGSTFAWLRSQYSSDIPTSKAVLEATYQSIVFGSGVLLPPLWTLKVEFIGSIYLLLFYIIKPADRHILPLLALLAMIAVIHRSDAVYYAAILFGSVLNKVQLQRGCAWGAFTLGIYFAGYQADSSMYAALPSAALVSTSSTLTKTIYNTFGAALVTAAVVSGGMGRTLLEHRIVQFLGRISFSIYLLHFIVLCSLASYLYVVMPRTPTNLALILSVYVTTCIVLSAAFERVIDRPAIAVARRFASHLFGRVEATPDQTAPQGRSP